MPWDKSHYPPNWPEVRQACLERSEGRCECCGECGLHRTHPGPRRCVERQHEPALWARGKIVLTTAHMCDCIPLCGDVTHLKMLCQRCHLRVDHELHKKHAAETRRKHKEAAGQLALLP
jgi:hypothetical protein